MESKFLELWNEYLDQPVPLHFISVYEEDPDSYMEARKDWIWTLVNTELSTSDGWDSI